MNYYFDVLKKYADFNGRARRKEYWMFLLFHIILIYGLMFLASQYPSAIYVYVVYVLGTFLPALAVSVRRMHDVGKSGWYILIPIYNLILHCTDGEEGKNEYGNNPKGFGDEINEIGTAQE